MLTYRELIHDFLASDTVAATDIAAEWRRITAKMADIAAELADLPPGRRHDLVDAIAAKLEGHDRRTFLLAVSEAVAATRSGVDCQHGRPEPAGDHTCIHCGDVLVYSRGEYYGLCRACRVDALDAWDTAVRAWRSWYFVRRTGAAPWLVSLRAHQKTVAYGNLLVSALSTGAAIRTPGSVAAGL